MRGIGLLSHYCERFEQNDPTLTICNLNGVHLGNAGARQLALALRRDSTIVVFFADNCAIGDEGAEALAESFARQSTLRYVYLSYNSFGDRGAAALMQSLAHSYVLNMTHNYIGDNGAKEIGYVLAGSHCNVRHLDLEGNQIHTKGHVAIAHGLHRNSSLRTLNLRGNLRTSSGVSLSDLDLIYRAFLNSVLSENRTLSELMVDEHTLTKKSELVSSVRHFIHLNKLGRHSFGNPTIKPSVWVRVLAKATNQAGESKTTLYEVLRMRPDLLVETKTIQGHC